MKKIANGYYNSVYDMGNGFVFKKQNNFFERYTKIFSEEYPNNGIIAIFTTLKIIYNMPKEHLSDLEIKIKNGTYTGSLEILANPKFDHRGYIQDKVITIKDYIKTHSYKENCLIVDRFAENVIECWKNEICEKVYNFTVNNGVSKNGNVVLIDFNESSQSKSDAVKIIESKKWLKALSFGHLDPDLQNYYQNHMEKTLIIEKLNDTWGISIKH